MRGKDLHRYPNPQMLKSLRKMGRNNTKQLALHIRGLPAASAGWSLDVNPGMWRAFCVFIEKYKWILIVQTRAVRGSSAPWPVLRFIFIRLWWQARKESSAVRTLPFKSQRSWRRRTPAAFGGISRYNLEACLRVTKKCPLTWWVQSNVSDCRPEPSCVLSSLLRSPGTEASVHKEGHRSPKRMFFFLIL